MSSAPASGRAGAGCEQDWCPGERLQPPPAPPAAVASGADGGYENQTRPGPGGDCLVKRYGRQRRFLAEQVALRLAEPTGLAPRLLGTCAPHAALRMQRLDAVPLHGAIGEDPVDRETAVRLAALLRRLHSVRAPRAGEFGAAGVLSWRSYLRHRMRQRVGSLPLDHDEAAGLWRYFEAGLTLIDERGKVPVLLHHDLKPANILTRGDGSLRLCDFDQARGGDPYCDLGKLAWRTFATGTNPSWRDFFIAYAGADASHCQLVVDFYQALHGIGALAYWHDYSHPGYLRHARAATALVARHTGVIVPLHHVREAATTRPKDPARG